MKKIKIFIPYLLTALVFSASALFLGCGFAERLPRGVYVNGRDVGGLTYSAAKAELRGEIEERLKSKRLDICADERVYTYAYPEIDYRDGFSELLPAIKKKGEYFAGVYYYLNGAEDIASAVCNDVYKPLEEPYAAFNSEGDPFTYYEGHDGAEADREKLLEDISQSLNGNFEKVTVKKRVLKRTLTENDIKLRTEKLYSFTTYFDGDNEGRSENIRLAAEKINGSVLNSGEIFSFNGTVGKRTEENGFKQAKIIQNGKFTLGFGGGVCQVSTTVYNAALLSGLEITEYHPHSLRVSYVSPSRDAMVSGEYYDLKFKNNRLTPIYVRMNCSLNSVTCTVYGLSDGYSYSFFSQITGEIPRPQTVEVEGEEDGVITYGREGTLSEGYLIRTKDGKSEKTLIREDKYNAVADTVTRRKK